MYFRAIYNIPILRGVEFRILRCPVAPTDVKPRETLEK